MASSGKLRCLWVGLGGITNYVLPIIRTKPWYETAGVVDVRPEALEKAKSSLALSDRALFRDLDAALRGSHADAVIVHTPSELHYAQVKVALEAGRHVLVAKPITNNYEQAVELVELADRKGVTLSVGQQIRYNRHYTAVRRFLAGGQLGPVELIYFLNAKPRHKAMNLATMDQPALYEMSCHHFDSLLSLFPDHAPSSITVDGFRPSWSVYSGPCMVNALIDLAPTAHTVGRLASATPEQRPQPIHLLYHGGFSTQADLYELRLEGAKGALRCRGIHMSNDTMAYEFAPRGGSWSAIHPDGDIAAQDPFVEFLDLWHAYVRGDAKSEPPFSGRNNLEVFALLSAGIDSIAAGGAPVRVSENARYAGAFPNR